MGSSQRVRSGDPLPRGTRALGESSRSPARPLARSDGARRSVSGDSPYAAAGADTGVDCSPEPGDRSGVSEPELREL
jgi:hypothetical protein